MLIGLPLVIDSLLATEDATVPCPSFILSVNYLQAFILIVNMKKWKVNKAFEQMCLSHSAPHKHKGQDFLKLVSETRTHSYLW